MINKKINKKLLILLIFFPILILFIPWTTISCSSSLPTIFTGVVNEQTQKISDITIPVSFEYSDWVASGTAWVFDKEIDDQNNNLVTYYLATNSHVVDLFAPKIDNNGSPVKYPVLVQMRLPKRAFQYQNNVKFDKNGILTDTSYNNIYEKKKLIESNIEQNGFYTTFNINDWIKSSNKLIYYSRDYKNSDNNVNGLFSFNMWRWKYIGLNSKENNDADFGIIQLNFKRVTPLPWFIQTWEHEYFMQEKNPFTNSITQNETNIGLVGFPSWSIEDHPNINSNELPAQVWTSAVSKSTQKITNLGGYNSININEPTTHRQTLLVPNLDLGHGSSGSCVMNDEGKIIGIYWGILSYKDGKKFGAIDLFEENQIINNWVSYLQNKGINSFLTSIYLK